MARIGNLYGPDATFLGVPAVDPDDVERWRQSAAVIIGAPFDGGTSHRPGCRFGPQAMRTTDYLPHDGLRPSLALGVDPLSDLAVVDLGDVEMPSGETELSLRRLEDRVSAVAKENVIPIVLGGDHTIALPDVTGIANHVGFGRVSVIHFDAHADTGESQMGSLYGHGTPMRRLIESGACRGDRFLQIGLRGYWPEPETLDWMAAQGMRSYEMGEIVSHAASTMSSTRRWPSRSTTVTSSFCRSTSTWSILAPRPAREHRNRGDCRADNSWTPCGSSR
jgi:agmatinase